PFAAGQRLERLAYQFERACDAVRPPSAFGSKSRDERRRRGGRHNGRPFEQDAVRQHAIEALAIVREIDPDLEMRIERQDGDAIVRRQRLDEMTTLQEHPHQADDARWLEILLEE